MDFQGYVSQVIGDASSVNRDLRLPRKMFRMSSWWSRASELLRPGKRWGFGCLFMVVNYPLVN